MNHRLIPAEYELAAAAKGELGAIVLPLDRYFNYPVTKVQHNGLGTAIYSDDFVMSFVERLSFQVGDRIFFAEEWHENDEGYSTLSEWLIYADREDCSNWYPAETMPEDAALYWYEITEIKVAQMKTLNYAKTGIYGECPGIGYHDHEVANVWNKAHPDYPWNDDRFVVVLEVKKCQLN